MSFVCLRNVMIYTIRHCTFNLIRFGSKIPSDNFQDGTLKWVTSVLFHILSNSQTIPPVYDT
jgi:hypothetical protein